MLSASPVITEYMVPTAASGPHDITAGPDGNLWFTEFDGGKIGKITPSGAITEFTLAPSFGGLPDGITAGPDGNLWFTNDDSNIGEIAPNGAITEFALPTTLEGREGITTGPDGNVWFTEGGSGKIGKITTDGTNTEFNLPTPGGDPSYITSGANGNLWFTEFAGNKIGEITPGGVITEFTIPTASSFPEGITEGPNGNVWFTESGGNKIGEITPSGVITEFTVPTAGSGPEGITTGPDGNVWFTESTYPGKIGEITPSGSITEFTLPSRGILAPDGITVGPDGNIWFTEFEGDNIGVLTLPKAQSPPTLSAPTTAGVSENGTLAFTAGNAISVSDTAGSGNNNEALTLGVNNGTLTLLPTSGSQVSGSGTATLTISGSLSEVNADLANLVYTPNTGTYGVDMLTVTLLDTTDQEQASPVEVTITVNPLAPIAVNDSYEVSENQTLTVSAPGVLANDTDPNSLTLTAVSFSTPAHGTLTPDSNGDGGFTYVPNPGFYGTDSYTYEASDPLATSALATVTITVNPLAPIAVNDSYSVSENQTLTVSPPGVLANDTDPNNLTLTAVSFSTPAHGTLTPDSNSDGGFTYVPNAGFYGTDSFTYEASDSLAASTPATVTITVNSPTLTITIPSGQTAFTIDASPKPTMPTITANVQINGSNQNLATTQFQWSAQIDFSDGSIDTSDTFKSTAAGGSVTFDKKVWGDQFRGGEVTLTATATVDGQQISATLSGLTITGQNPDASTVLTYLEGKSPPAKWPTGTSYNYGQLLGAIAEQENHGHIAQFDSDGMPIIASDNGVGIMQITPFPPGTNIDNPNQVWDWQANLNGGVAIFNSKLTSANAYATKLQKAVNKPRTALHNAVLAAEKADGYAGLRISIPPMTADEIVLNAIRGYNGFAGTDAYGNPLEEFELATDLNGNLVLSDVNLTAHTASLSWIEVPASSRPSGRAYVAGVLGWYSQL